MNLVPISSLQSFDYTHMCRDKSLEGVAYGTVTFSKLTWGIRDMRQFVPGLESYGRRILPREVVVDSDMSLAEAFKNLSSECPDSILGKQQLLRVFYFGTDNRLHQGQVVVHAALAEDVCALFEMIVRTRLPIGSVVPMSASRFTRRDHSEAGKSLGRWDEYLSMEANNSSSFNYRRMLTPTGEKKPLSLHGLGMALDINPGYNPRFADPSIHVIDSFTTEAAAGYRGKLPSNSTYDPEHPATMTSRHPIVRFLTECGWTWGGTWGEPLDYNHFQKVPDHLKDEVAALRGM